jgi:iron-sulfur cluster assembly protein
MITLTDAAVDYIKNSLKKRGHGIGFRLSIKKTGCSGYTYVPTLIDEPVATDLHFMAQQELPIYIDPACENLIKGLVMDSVVDHHMGLKQKKLVFINPNEKNRCGCGESFTVE